MESYSLSSMSPAAGSTKDSGAARILGSGTSGMSPILLTKSYFQLTQLEVSRNFWFSILWILSPNDWWATKIKYARWYQVRCNRIQHLACRSRSRQLRLSSSAMLQVNQYFLSCCLCSLVLVMPQATRLLSGYTSLVVSHTSTMSFPGITKHSSQTPLERGRERWWCRPRPEGLYFHPVFHACGALIGGLFQ